MLSDFRADVAAHYRSRGYTIHERVKVRGNSGSVHACDMIAQGSLGNLIVSFGDESGVDATELSFVKRTAKDIGAAAVVAVSDPTDPVREAARRTGVKLLDQRALDSVEPIVETPPPEVAEHPWPEQEPRIRQAKRHSRDAATAGAEAAGFWKQERSSKRGGDKPFGWLDGDDTDIASSARPAAVEAEAGAIEVAAPLRQRTRAPPEPGRPAEPELPRSVRASEPVRRTGAPAATSFPWHWVWGPALYFVMTALLLLLAAYLFG